jgi:hypothetical protein
MIDELRKWSKGMCMEKFSLETETILIDSASTISGLFVSLKECKIFRRVRVFQKSVL